MVRKNDQVETRMVAEYLEKNYSSFPYKMGVPLGALPAELLAEHGFAKTLGMIRPYRPEVDAIVVLPRHFLLIEAKVWNIINGLAKLPIYKSLVSVTPELQKYQPRDILMQLVVGWESQNARIMAADHGISIKVFCPDWLKEKRDSMHKYWTKEYQKEREDKLRMRAYFGVD